ncbi:MAG: RES family NAD+ phosphorylase [Chitinophagaceae bacterium]|nr:RES family NAD+ phosphorylase [Chitinophagaceae bacterium]
MIVYRITQQQFATDLSGNGARLYGGRWNSEGLYALYTAGTRALALLETLAHTPVQILPAKKYSVLSLEVPDEGGMEIIPLKKLKLNWDAWDLQFYTQKPGDAFLKANKHLVLQVPSVLVHEEFNYIINPLHKSAGLIKILNEKELKLNERLLKAV